MEKAHNIQKVFFKGTIMHLAMDGQDYQVDVAAESPRLANATQKQRENFEISPSGYGIHWPDLDEDLSIDGLLSVKHEPAFVESEV